MVEDMKILAIDTSSAVLSIGLMKDGVILGEFSQNKALTHSEKLMPQIRHLFESLEEDIKTVDRFAVTIGPGSFTGIRIGVATANAFAMAHQKEIVAISTLEALAHNFVNSDAYIVTTMSAQREDYYRGIYFFESDRRFEVYREEQVVSKTKIIDEILEISEEKKVIIVGEITQELEADAEFIKCQNQQKSIIEIAQGADNYIRGAVLCQIAQESNRVSEGFASPVYIRKPQAEEQYEARQRQRMGHE